jgi:hypothetical protein
LRDAVGEISQGPCYGHAASRSDVRAYANVHSCPVTQRSAGRIDTLDIADITESDACQLEKILRGCDLIGGWVAVDALDRQALGKE